MSDKSQPAPKPNHANSRLQIPMQLTFKSLQAQKVMHRVFEPLKRSTFHLSVILRIICDPEAMSKVDEHIETEFTNFTKEIQAAQARLQTLLDNAGIDGLGSYSKPETYDLVLDNPRAVRFLKLIAELDTLMSMIDTAWIHAEINDKQKSQETYKYTQMLMKVAGKIINLERQTRAYAARKGKEAEVEQEAPRETAQLDPELVKASEPAKHKDLELAEAV